jgi:hypothetical protein
MGTVRDDGYDSQHHRDDRGQDANLLAEWVGAFYLGMNFQFGHDLL